MSLARINDVEALAARVAMPRENTWTARVAVAQRDARRIASDAVLELGPQGLKLKGTARMVAEASGQAVFEVHGGKVDLRQPAPTRRWDSTSRERVILELLGAVPSSSAAPMQLHSESMEAGVWLGREVTTWAAPAGATLAQAITAALGSRAVHQLTWWVGADGALEFGKAAELPEVGAAHQVKRFDAMDLRVDLADSLATLTPAAKLNGWPVERVEHDIRGDELITAAWFVGGRW